MKKDLCPCDSALTLDLEVRAPWTVSVAPQLVRSVHSSDRRRKGHAERQVQAGGRGLSAGSPGPTRGCRRQEAAPKGHLAEPLAPGCSPQICGTVMSGAVTPLVCGHGLGQPLVICRGSGNQHFASRMPLCPVSPPDPSLGSPSTHRLLLGTPREYLSCDLLFLLRTGHGCHSTGRSIPWLRWSHAYTWSQAV